MFASTRWLAAVLVCAGLAGAQESRPGSADALGAAASRGPFKIAKLDENWLDDARNRTVPIRAWLPALPDADAASSRAPTRFPVIVLSPGLGGSRATYGYLAQHLATHGYLVVALKRRKAGTFFPGMPS